MLRLTGELRAVRLQLIRGLGEEQMGRLPGDCRANADGKQAPAPARAPAGRCLLSALPVWSPATGEASVAPGPEQADPERAARSYLKGLPSTASAFQAQLSCSSSRKPSPIASDGP